MRSPSRGGEIVFRDYVKESLYNAFLKFAKLSKEGKFPDSPFKRVRFPIRAIVNKGVKDVTNSKNPGLKGNLHFPKPQVPRSIEAFMVQTSKGNIGFHELVSHKDSVKLKNMRLYLRKLLLSKPPRFQEDFSRDKKFSKVMDESSNADCFLFLLR